MSYNDDDDDNQAENSAGGGGLRKQLEAALAEMKELKVERDKLKSQEISRTVGASLSEKGFKPEQAKFVPADIGADPARLETWITENASLLARKDEEQNAASETDDGGKPNLSDGTAEAYSKIQKISDGGSHAPVDLDALLAKMKDPSLTEEQFDNLISSYKVS